MSQAPEGNQRISNGVKVLAVITARGGSKGIPGKNIKPLGGKPLIAYTIEVAQKSRLITDLIVSTDSERIAGVSREYGANVPFIRPAELARDDTPHLPVMRHAVEFMEKQKGYQYDYVVTLQPTSPFRTVEDIDETIRVLIESGADSSVSLVEVPGMYHPIKMKKLEGNQVLPYCMDEPEGIRKQDFPKVYRRSSAVYVTRRDLMIKENKFFGEHVVGYITSIERFIDIDSESDWLNAENILVKMINKKIFRFK